MTESTDVTGATYGGSEGYRIDPHDQNLNEREASIPTQDSEHYHVFFARSESSTSTSTFTPSELLHWRPQNPAPPSSRSYTFIINSSIPDISDPTSTFSSSTDPFTIYSPSAPDSSAYTATVSSGQLSSRDYDADGPAVPTDDPWLEAALPSVGSTLPDRTSNLSPGTVVLWNGGSAFSNPMSSSNDWETAREYFSAPPTPSVTPPPPYHSPREPPRLLHGDGNPGNRNLRNSSLAQRSAPLLAGNHLPWDTLGYQRPMVESVIDGGDVSVRPASDWA